MDYVVEFKNELIQIEQDPNRSIEDVINILEAYHAGFDDIAINNFICEHPEYLSLFDLLARVPAEKTNEALAIVKKFTGA